VDDLYETRGLLQRSLAIDPNYARSFAVLAGTHLAVWINRLDSDYLSPDALDRAHRFAQKAVELDPDLAEAHASLGFALVFRREFDVSIAEFERAIVLNPNHVNWPFGVALVFSGDSRRAIDVIKDYVRLDPLHTPLASGILGFAHYMLKHYAQALPMLRDCVSRAPNIRSGHVFLAATYAQMGQLEQALVEVAEVMRLDPNYTIGGVARPTVNRRPTLTPRSLGRSITWLANRRRDPTPINSLVRPLPRPAVAAGNCADPVISAHQDRKHGVGIEVDDALAIAEQVDV
jgi:adenylate cyclase